MTWPLIILAILSFAGGWVGIRALGDHWNRFLAPAFQLASAVPAEQAVPEGGTTEIIFTAVSVAFSLLGVGLAWLFYLRKPWLSDAFATRFGRLYTLVSKKYFVDEVYTFLFVRPLVVGSREVLWKAFDEWTIDGMVNFAAHRTRRFGDRLRRIQSGNLRSYSGWVLLGALFLIAFMVMAAS